MHRTIDVELGAKFDVAEWDRAGPTSRRLDRRARRSKTFKHTSSVVDDMLAEAEYHRAETLSSAFELLADHPDAMVVAGGQSLGLLVKEGIVSPEVVVDISRIEELQGLERDGDTLRLGALTTHRTVETSDLVADTVPVLAEAAAQIADVQIRNAGTIGGVCAYADPTADYPPVLMTVGATVHATSPNGETDYAAADGYFSGYYESELEDDELVTAVSLPVLGDATGAGFEKLAYRKNDRAIVNAAAVVEVDGDTCVDASLAVGAVGDRPELAANAAAGLVDTELTDDDLAAAAERAREEVPVSPDPLVSEEYRSAMVENLARDALVTARNRATAGGDR